MTTHTTEEHITEADLLNRLRELELETITQYTLADAIREGSSVSTQSFEGWGNGERVCALSAARLAARARGYIT